MNKGLEALKEIKYKLSELDFKLRSKYKTAPYIQETKWCTIEKELLKPQELYNKIKEKRDNAEIHLERERNKEPLQININTLHNLEGEIGAYHDILCLMESMGLDK